MSQENVEIVRRAFEAFNRTYAAGTTDLSEFLDFLDPDVEWVPIMAVLEGTTYDGHEGMRQWVEDTKRELGGVLRAEARAVPGPGRRPGLGPGLVACTGPGGGDALLDIPQAAWLIQDPERKGRSVADLHRAKARPSKPPGFRSRRCRRRTWRSCRESLTVTCVSRRHPRWRLSAAARSTSTLRCWSIEPPELPDAKSYRGHDGVVEALGDWPSQWDEFRAEILEVIDGGETVVQLTRRSSGLGTWRLSRTSPFVYMFKDQQDHWLGRLLHVRQRPSRPPGFRSRRCRRRTQSTCTGCPLGAGRGHS